MRFQLPLANFTNEEVCSLSANIKELVGKYNKVKLPVIGEREKISHCITEFDIKKDTWRGWKQALKQKYKNNNTNNKNDNDNKIINKLLSFEGNLKCFITYLHLLDQNMSQFLKDLLDLCNFYIQNTSLIATHRNTLQDLFMDCINTLVNSLWRIEFDAINPRIPDVTLIFELVPQLLRIIVSSEQIDGEFGKYLVSECKKIDCDFVLRNCCVLLVRYIDLNKVNDANSSSQTNDAYLSTSQCSGILEEIVRLYPLPYIKTLRDVFNDAEWKKLVPDFTLEFNQLLQRSSPPSYKPPCCMLCRRPDQLKESTSHEISKCIYDVVLEKTGYKIYDSTKQTEHKSDAVKWKMCCRDCEGMFSNQGETHLKVWLKDYVFCGTKLNPIDEIMWETNVIVKNLKNNDVSPLYHAILGNILRGLFLSGPDTENPKQILSYYTFLETLRLFFMVQLDKFLQSKKIKSSISIPCIENLPYSPKSLFYTTSDIKDPLLYCVTTQTYWDSIKSNKYSGFCKIMPRYQNNKALAHFSLLGLQFLCFSPGDVQLATTVLDLDQLQLYQITRDSLKLVMNSGVQTPKFVNYSLSLFRDSHDTIVSTIDDKPTKHWSQEIDILPLSIATTVINDNHNNCIKYEWVSQAGMNSRDMILINERYFRYDHFVLRVILYSARELDSNFPTHYTTLLWDMTFDNFKEKPTQHVMLFLVTESEKGLVTTLLGKAGSQLSQVKLYNSFSTNFVRDLLCGESEANSTITKWAQKYKQQISNEIIQDLITQIDEKVTNDNLNINHESDDNNIINNNLIKKEENNPEKIEENKEDNENISNNNKNESSEIKENEQEIEKASENNLQNNSEEIQTKNEEKNENEEKKEEIEIDFQNKSPSDLSKPENVIFSPSLRTESKNPSSSSPSDATFINTLLQSNQEDEIIYSSGEFSNFSPYSSSEMATSSLRPSSLTKNSEKASTEATEALNIAQSPTSPMRKRRDRSVVLDPQMVEQIEQNARNLAQNVDHLIGSLSSSLHAISTISTSYMENYQKASDSLGDATANGVAGMYSFLNKIKQLNSNLSEVDRIADEVKEIKKVVDVMEYFAIKYASE